MIRYLFLTVPGGHFPHLIRQETIMPGSYEWFKAFNKFSGCSGEIRNIQDVANTEFLKYDIIHVNLSGLSGESILAVKEITKGSSTRLVLNLDYGVQQFADIDRWRYDVTGFIKALECADFLFAQTEYQRSFLQLIWKHILKRQQRIPLITHPLDTEGLKKFYVDPKERRDTVAVMYHRYDKHLLIPSIIAKGGEKRTVGKFHDLKVEVPTQLFGYDERTLDLTFFDSTSLRHRWDKYIYMLSHCTEAISYYSKDSQDRFLAECACLGIPAVATTHSVFGRRLFPRTTFKPHHLEAMINAMRRLKEDDAFWNYVKDYAWKTVENFSDKPSVERLLGSMRSWGIKI